MPKDLTDIMVLKKRVLGGNIPIHSVAIMKLRRLVVVSTVDVDRSNYQIPHCLSTF